jgi:nitrate/nitrite transporter NarK
VLALVVTAMGLQSFPATFWALPTAMLSGLGAAGGLALINSAGNTSGFFAPIVFGLIKDAHGGANGMAIAVIAIAPVISALILLLLGHDRRLERIPPHA